MQLSLFSSKPPAAKPATPGIAEKIRQILGPKLPAGAIDQVVEHIAADPISIKVVNHRTSKSGDFRAAHGHNAARITVNGNLNPYAFLITLVHELAHHHVSLDYARASKKFTLRRKKRPLPHGKEWKQMFCALMKPYLNSGIFPNELLPVVIKHFINPKASSSADHKLSKALKKYDPPDDTIRLEELPFDAVFSIHGRRLFRKKEKARTRYRCICLQTNRIYLVSPNAPVEKVNV